MPDIEPILSRLDGVRKTQKGFSAKCPAHEDKTASLSLMQSGDKILMHCFAGCTTADVLASIGMELADLFDKRTESPAMHRRDIANALSIACAQTPSVGYDIEVCMIGIQHTLAGKPFATRADEDCYLGAMTRVLAILNQFNQLRKRHG